MNFGEIPVDELIRVRGDKNFGRFDSSKYHFNNSGTVYEGEMKNGHFHGKGKLIFENGGQYSAIWENGKAVEDGKYTFPDGLEYDEDNWEYCTGYDRKYHVENLNGLKPAGRENLIDEELDNVPGFIHKIPEHAFDTADGYYLSEERRVYDYSGKFLRVADNDEHEFILK